LRKDAASADLIATIKRNCSRSTNGESHEKKKDSPVMASPQ